MIHSIVSHGYTCPVIWRNIFVWFCSCIHSEESLSYNATRLAMIREERKTILSREDIVGNAKILHPQLCLNEIDKAQSKVLGLLESSIPFLLRRIYNIGIEVIAIDRPIDHIPASRGLSISDHHLRRPHCLPCLCDSVAQRIEAGISKKRRIVTLRTFYGHVSIWTVILQKSHISKVLDHVIRLFRGDRLSRIRRRLHADTIIHTTFFCHITKLCCVNQDFRLDLSLFAFGITENNCPAFVLLTERKDRRIPMDSQKIRAGLCHIGKHLLTDVRIKIYIAHPAALKSRISAVTCCQ